MPQCFACAKGTYRDSVTLAQECTTCAYAKFSNKVGSTVCSSCGIYGFPNEAKTDCVCVGGTYLTLNAALVSTCVACEVGSISNGASCTRCAPGTVCSPNIDTTISPCPTAGMFKANTVSTCAACPLGTVVVLGGCAPCAEGTYANNAQQQCVECAPNTYQPSTGASSIAMCLTCPTGLVSNGGAAACVCPAGSYIMSGGACVLCKTTCASPSATMIQFCPMGSVQDTTQCACAGQGNGYYQNDCVACPTASANQCACASGSYYDTETCKACKTSCPFQYTTLRGECVKGTVGKDATTCVCADQMFWNGAGCSMCKICHPNAATTVSCVMGSTADVVECSCNAGYAGNGLTCLPCPVCALPKTLSAPCDATTKNPNSVQCK